MFQYLIVLNCILVVSVASSNENLAVDPPRPDLATELLDENWDQIQKGQWLVGFFDNETKESLELEQDWNVFALKCKEYQINVGHVFAPQNPGLYVRFLVTVFPKVFYVKNGVAHEVPKVNRQVLVELIKDKQWDKLKPVNFLKNPFSVQMSLLSHLFVYAVILYNFENSIVQSFVSAPFATDVAFGLTFIVVGTFLGLFLTCLFGFAQIYFMDSKDLDDDVDEDEKEDKKEDNKEKDKEEPEKSVRKRK